MTVAPVIDQRTGSAIAFCGLAVRIFLSHNTPQASSSSALPLPASTRSTISRRQAAGFSSQPSQLSAMGSPPSLRAASVSSTRPRSKSLR
nr:MAG TPA: hypothetical protein [Caudoviricetes sp.]